ncbi:MAG: ribonuclease E/G, partial [Eubacteriales bacterium]|nr:ribonuclease E/G [Eubacteriales bacterium]
KKDEKGGKGGFLPRDIACPGHLLLLMPNNRFIGVSKRVTEELERSKARAIGEKLSQGRFGLIVRHAALYATQQEMEDELRLLLDKWERTVKAVECQKAPVMLDYPASTAQTLANDYAARHEIELECDADFDRTLPPSVRFQLLSPLELEAKWNASHVERQVNEALKRLVPLQGGGSLIIDEREALQTVDVNSGSAVTTKDGLSLPLQQNVLAVPEIARQLRLRNLCGIVLVDFIDMQTEEERAQVRAAMEEAVADDRVKTVIHGFTNLGLLELTRQRTRDSLRDALMVGCKACGETGRIRNG